VCLCAETFDFIACNSSKVTHSVILQFFVEVLEAV
jgi:hypothetical protein